ncbi:hypothetical protein SBD_5765 [Streptomyces bottropensis ATCC 25435]|uniref:Uncharacterized protein n=1 Tax=Streptomyces bottropensis ATCC 25435 TaxID=1054862 RepID=M3FIG1_9ACTN|nr:hypothetical protein SBD_5765 [Streptomyces bottropensis ATCC 25435]
MLRPNRPDSMWLIWVGLTPSCAAAFRFETPDASRSFRNSAPNRACRAVGVGLDVMPSPRSSDELP